MKELMLFLVTMFFIMQCGLKSEKKESFQEAGPLDQLALILLVSPRTPATPVDTRRVVSDGSRCDSSEVKCSSASYCLGGSFYDPLLFGGVCVRVPTAIPVSVNGSAQSGKIVTSAPMADFEVPIEKTGKYLFLLHQAQGIFGTLQVLSSNGETLQYADERSHSGKPVPLLIEIYTPATYRIRALSYRAFSNYTFGGNLLVQVLGFQNSIPTSGSCNLFTNSTLSHCLDYVQSSSYAASSCDGTYTASQTCAEVNSGRTPTKVGSCLYSERNKPGQGGIVKNYYSSGTGIVAPTTADTASSDCNTRAPSIYQ